jgi:hypothetical protein
LSASSPGFFAGIEFVEASYAPIGGDRTLDFELEPLVRIALGEVVALVVSRLIALSVTTRTAR